MWSTPAVRKQYNKMAVLHFFLVNSTLIYILFSLAWIFIDIGKKLQNISKKLNTFFQKIMCQLEHMHISPWSPLYYPPSYPFSPFPPPPSAISYPIKVHVLRPPLVIKLRNKDVNHIFCQTYPPCNPTARIKGLNLKIIK